MRLVIAPFALALIMSSSVVGLAAPAPEDPHPIPNMPRTAPLPAPNAAPDKAPAAPGARAAARTAPAPVTVDQLLDRLKVAEDERTARGIERQIQEIWARSGSATAELLMERGAKALADEDFETADALMVKVTELVPAYAEGWHRRAAVAMHKEDFEAAVTSLRQVLVLQPKHYVAMAELGGILQDFGDKEHALAAYRQAFELNPHIEGIEDRIRELTRSVEGQGI
jgi:Flp pilus assembly protein TadD